jgi:hypothetical protein
VRFVFDWGQVEVSHKAPVPSQHRAIAVMRESRSLQDLRAHAREIADAFERFEPDAQAFQRALPPLMAVKLAVFRHREAERDLAAAVQRARAAGISWATLGGAIGISAEAARHRYGSTPRRHL